MIRRQLAFWGRHRVLAAVLLALAALLIGAAVELIRISRDLDAGRNAIDDLQLESLDSGLLPTVEQAAARLRRAEQRADSSPFLGALAVIPGVKTQVDALRDLTDVGAELGRTGVDAAKAIEVELDAAAGDAARRISLLDTVLAQLDRVEEAVEEVDVGAGGPLLPPLADARREVVRQLDDAPDRLDEARFYVRGLRRLLAGPSRYLLLASNNAEMRGGAGSPLSGGVVTIQDGDIQFGEFRQLVGIRTPLPTDVRPPAAWASTYHNWIYGRSYLETSVSPNFEATGPLYRAMSPAAGFGEVDGVLAVDAVALANLLEVIGPVELDGVTYDKDNVAQQILNENYKTFGNIYEERGARVELQSALAAQIFEAFKQRNLPINQLALALEKAAIGRHLLAYSADPAIQSLWRSINASGRLHPSGLAVLAENVAANKLDWYLQMKVSMSVVPAAVDDGWAARINVTIHNPDVEDTTFQIDGGFYGLEPGDHRAMVAAYLPAQAYNIRTSDNVVSEAGLDPPLHMIAQRVDIPRGETRRVTFEFSLPEDVVGALILPGGRAHPVEYEVNGLVVTDATPVPVFWISTDDDETPGAPAVSAVLALLGSVVLLVVVRTRDRHALARPLRPVPELVQRAPAFAALLYLAAVAVLVAGALIDSAA